MNAPQPNVNIPNAIFFSLSKLWRETDSADFQVVIGGETFPCHSYLLESCSEFFRYLLRSDMKEKQVMRVELKNMSASTFRLVLKTLYEGADLLTRENFLEFWRAVDLLQIPFLTEHCEQFAMMNLCFHTLDSLKTQAEYLQSQKVISFIFKFMVENFVKFRETEGFLKLSFEELTKLIKSEELLADSEDLVMLSVFDWVNYGEVLVAGAGGTVNHVRGNEPTNDSSHYNETGDSSRTSEKQPNKNEDSTEIMNPTVEKELLASVTTENEPNLRKKRLFELIKSTRYCLVSERCFAKLYQNKLALNDTWVKDILSQASAYKQSCITRGICPTAAVHRDCSSFEHIAVTSFAQSLYAFSFKKRKFFPMQNLRNAVKFTVFMGNLYACASTEGSTSIYVLQSNQWLAVYGPMVSLWGNVKIFIAHKSCIYLFSGNKIRSFDPIFGAVLFETQAHNIESPEHALSFYEKILVFSSVEGRSGAEETAVHAWHTDAALGTDVWTQLYVLPFSCLNMVSFCDDVHAYILDSNGNLWKLVNSDVIEFTFLASLWTLKTPLRGAVLFKDTLYLVPDVHPTNSVTAVKGVFASVHFFRLDQTSSLVHYVIDKRDLASH